jgi:hypothetical protein
MAEGNKNSSSSRHGIFISVGMAGTIAGVSILFALAASHGAALNGISQLLTPTPQNAQYIQDEKKDASSTAAPLTNSRQDTQVSTIEVKQDQGQQPEQKNEQLNQNVFDNQKLPVVESPETAGQNMNEQPGVDLATSPTRSEIKEPSPPVQEVAPADENDDEKPKSNNVEDANNKPIPNNPSQDPTASSLYSRDVAPAPPVKLTQEQEKKQFEEQQGSLQQTEEQQQKELEEKVQKQTEELQKKIQEVLDHTAGNVDEAEKKLTELYTRAPVTLHYLFDGIL